MYWQNTVDGYCEGKQKLCDKIIEFVHKNTNWVHKKLESLKNKGSNPYWHHLSLIYDQLEGLESGYNAKVRDEETPEIPHGDIFWMNVFGDLEDLEQVFDINDEFNKTRILGRWSVARQSSCTCTSLPTHTLPAGTLPANILPTCTLHAMCFAC